MACLLGPFVSSVMCFFLVLLVGHLLLAANASNFLITWGDGRAKILGDGQQLTLSLDQVSGSGFQSKNQHLFGKFDMQIKLVPGDSSGTVTTFYVSHLNHIGFASLSKCSRMFLEFVLSIDVLTNQTGQPYILHTNVYSQGKGNREEQFYLWFDPREDFHTYSVSWNPQNIIFFVDGTPVRQFKNMESIGVPFPNKQPMRIYSSLWDGEDWATEGGRIKTDWTKAPFTASYGGFSINACKISPRGNSCAASKSTVTTTSAGGAYSNIVNSWMNEEIDFTNQEKLNWVRQNYMVYNYCMDTNRFPQGLPPECNVS